MLKSLICLSHKLLIAQAKYCKMSAPTVFVTRYDIPKEGLALLKSKCNYDIYEKGKPIPRAELLERVKGKNGLYCMITEKVDAELLDAAGENLKVIGTMSVGHDHIDLKECRKRGILVGNTPDVLTDATAELTVGLLLATSRRLVEASKEVVNGGWNECSWAPLWMCGTALAGSTVGIVGLGRIGFAVAERLKAFKVEKILYCGNKEKATAKENLQASFVSFDDLLQASDFVVVCCALTPETSQLFTLEAFKKMKTTSIFVNSSRGGIVNQDDLYTALTTGLITAAGLDVMSPEPLPIDHKLTKLTNCVLLPHVGSATVTTRVTMALLTAKNVLAGLEGKPLPCPI